MCLLLFWEGGVCKFLYDSAFLTNLPVSPGFFSKTLPSPFTHTHTRTHTHTHTHTKEGDTYKFMTPPPPNFVNALKIYLS